MGAINHNLHGLHINVAIPRNAGYVSTRREFGAQAQNFNSSSTILQVFLINKMSFNISSLPSYFYGVHFSQCSFCASPMCDFYLQNIVSKIYSYVIIAALRQTQSTTKIFKCTCSKHEEFAKRFQTGYSECQAAHSQVLEPGMMLEQSRR